MKFVKQLTLLALMQCLQGFEDFESTFASIGLVQALSTFDFAIRQ